MASATLATAIAAFGLARLVSGNPGRSTRLSTAAPTPTPAGGSTGCAQPQAGSGPLVQGWDGTLSGCIRLDARAPGAYIVSLSTIVTGPRPATPTPGTTATMVLDPPSGAPGTEVTVIGHYAGPLPGGPTGHAYACWDGCPNGLREDGVEVTWGPAGTFRTKVVVPDTAWLEHGEAHPLASGTYPIDLECLGAEVKGCATMPAQASALFHLVAPPPHRCVAHQPCGELHLAPDHGVAGSMLAVSGWAPLAEIIGTPFGYTTDVNAPGAGPRVGVTALLKGAAERSTVADAPLRVDPAPPWSGLDAADQLWHEHAGTTLIAADPADARRFGYCASGSIQLSGDGGTTFSTVPTKSIAAALAATPYQLPAGPGEPACSDLALDPHRAATLYAGVTVNPNGEAPPFALVGMESVDAGAHWSLIRTPPGGSPGAFSDFRADPGGVDAIFSAPPAGSPTGPPPSGAPPAPLRVQRSTDGGLSWAPSHLPCPGTGPCATFGDYWQGNCAMNGSFQALQYSSDGGATWSSPDWPSMVNACASPKVAGLGDGSLLLIDPASGYLLRRSADGGHTWTYVSSPPLPGTTPGQADLTGGITLLPDGGLMSVGTASQWYLLSQGASSWCPVAPTGGQPSFVTDPTVIADRLWWLASPATPAPGQTPTLTSRSLSSLACARR